MSNSFRETAPPVRERQLTALVDRWVESLERARDHGDSHEKTEPLSTTSPDKLQLVWNGGRLSHVGQLRPAILRSVSADDCLRLVGHARAAMALWQALHQFGVPFDAVNAHSWIRGPFSWGTWGFDAPTTAEIIGAAGKRVAAGTPTEEPAALPPELAPLRDGNEAALVDLAAQPRAIALLAEAARLPAAQHGQLEVIVQRSLRPLAHDRFTDAELVALLVLDQRTGLGTARELVAQVTSTGADQRGRVSWVAVATRHLAAAGQPLTRREWQQLSSITQGRE